MSIDPYKHTDVHERDTPTRMLTVPPTVQSAQHGITIQVKSRPPTNARSFVDGQHYQKQKHTEWQYFVPPMSPVFETSNGTHSNKRAQTDDGIKNTHGQWFDDGPYTNDRFVGVSVEGLPNGGDVVKHGEKMAHYTVVTRGIVTVMCDYTDTQHIGLMKHVKVKCGERKYRGMGVNKFFSIEECTDQDDASKHSIGILLSKPTLDDKANEVRLLLC